MQTLYRFKGTVATTNELGIIENRVIGDVYKCEADLHDYIWNGQDWVDIGQNVDFTEIMKKVEDLNQSQQDMLDDMSKTYTGSNITGPTVSGYGTIHKLYGHTIEEGTGEKSPSNPYTLKCVGDDVNLFDKNLHIELDGKYRHASNGQQINNTSVYDLKIPVNPNTDYILNADITNDNVTNLCFFNSEMTYLSGNNFTGNDKIFQTPNSCKYITSAISKNFTKLKLQQGLVATPYSPYGYGTVEIISQNGDQQSSNVVVTKPLCCLRDGDGNIIAQDWIDYDKGVVHRECGYLRLHEIEPSYTTIRGDYFIAQFNVSSYKLKSVVLCNFLQYLDGGNWDIEKESISYGGSTGNSIQVKVLKNRLATVDSAGLLSFLGSVNATVVYQLTTLLEEPLDCSNKIVQYADKTTVSNRDGAEIEVSLTNNKAISEVNGELGVVQKKLSNIQKGYEQLNQNYKQLAIVNNQDFQVNLTNDKLSNYKFLAVVSGYGNNKSTVTIPVCIFKSFVSSVKQCRQIVATYNSTGYTAISYINDTSFMIYGACGTDTVTAVYGIK